MIVFTKGMQISYNNFEKTRMKKINFVDWNEMKCLNG